MVRRPKDLEEAKEIFREEKNKVFTSFSAIAGSRWLMAILATFALSFGAHALYARDRLPSVQGLSLAQAGLPPSVDFGYAGEQFAEARAAAKREGAPARLEEALSAGRQANENFIWYLNLAGFGATLLLLLGNMWIMTKRRRVSRG